MKTIQKIALAIALVSMVYACKEAQEHNNLDVAEETAEEVAVVEENATDEAIKSVVSSSAAVEPKNSNKKFVRTANVRFKVKNVAKSTEAIENATHKFGGFVTYTHLQSTIEDKTETRVSQDSILETIKYQVTNNITLRVPNTKLDTLLKTIAREIDFLDSRLIETDDVTLQILANKMAQNRNNTAQNRMKNAVDQKGKKLNQIINAEDQINQKGENIDEKNLENLSLNNQVNYSTITFNIYQRETIKNTLFASEKSINKYRPHLGKQILDSVKTGWYMLESVIAFIVQLWAIFLIGFLVWYGFKKLKKNS